MTVVEGSGPNAKAVTFARKTQWEEADEALGGYVLRTSQTGWDLKHIVATYWRLSEVEATFRSLKSELGMRPLYHSKDARIAAHISIAVYAYHAVHLIRTRLKAQDIHTSWKTLRQKLSAWQTGDDDPKGHPGPGDCQRAGRAPKGRTGSDSADLRRHAQPASPTLRAPGLGRAQGGRKVVPARREYTLFLYVENVSTYTV